MENQLIKTEIKKHVAVVTMDAPPVNAQSKEFVEELISAFDELNATPSVRVIVLTGAGKIFSAGADIKSRNSSRDITADTYRHLRRAREAGFCIMESNKAVIAAVNGPALGAGMGLAVCCDIIMASENAVFGLPEIDIGLMGGVRHTMRLMPLSLTRKMVLSGYRVPAAELYRRGIIEECVPLDQLMPSRDQARERDRQKEPDGVETGQACDQHRRDHGPQGRLSFRAEPDRRNDPA